MPRKQKEILNVMQGKDQHAKAVVEVEKMKAKAIKELTEMNTPGFAMFFVRTDKKGRSKGVQTIVGGAMGVEDTLNMGNAMHETGEKMVVGMLEGMRERME
jgi:hypothetical protein